MFEVILLLSIIANKMRPDSRDVARHVPQRISETGFVILDRIYLASRESFGECLRCVKIDVSYMTIWAFLYSLMVHFIRTTG